MSFAMAPERLDDAPAAALTRAQLQRSAASACSQIGDQVVDRFEADREAHQRAAASAGFARIAARS